MEEKILIIDHLCAGFLTEKGEARAVNDVSLEVPAGKVVGIMGESGCGKNVVARAVMGLLRRPDHIDSGQILLEGREITRLPERELRRLRGSKVSMIFREPMTGLDPVRRIGRQVEEAILLHRKLTKDSVQRSVLEALEEAGIHDSETCARRYPHQLSAGQRQRVMIAMAIICRPRLLIAEEPTAVLDVTDQAQILRLLRKLCSDGTGVLLTSSDPGVIAHTCDHVYVMDEGKIVEHADTLALFNDPEYSYTRGYLDAAVFPGMETGE